jgi:hypothetical protein
MTLYDWTVLEQFGEQKWSWEIINPQFIKSFLYFIQETDDQGLIKIGVSRKPKKRLHELQVGNSKNLQLIAMRKGLRQDEQRIHRMFTINKVRGELFEPSLRLLALIEELKE